MKTILVVRRSFKSQGEFYPVGSIIEDPAKVKFLRTKLTEGKIVELAEDSPQLEFMIDYLELRTDLPVRENVAKAFKPAKQPEKAQAKPKAKGKAKTTKTAPAK